ncbi:MAG: hypothetical protein RLZZ216_1380 [Cyanobacteriota bacterium]|jgi:hypothetical protein
MRNLKKFFGIRFLFFKFLFVGFLLFLLIGYSFYSVAQGRPARSQVEGKEPGGLELIRQLDPECNEYGRCDDSFKRTFGSITVTSIRGVLSDPESFQLRGNVSFTWIPEAYPDWSPDRLKFSCRIRDCDFPGWTSVVSSSTQFTRTWTAEFSADIKEAISLDRYPFDQHWLHLKITGRDPLSQQFIEYLSTAYYDIELSRRVVEGMTSDFYVDYATASTSIDSTTNNFLTLKEPTPLANFERIGDDVYDKKKNFSEYRPYDTSAFVVSFFVKRRVPAALWMITIPLSLILLNTVLAFHWRENSPASRFGSSGLLTAVSLFFASRIFRPSVDYLVFTDLWFLITFVVITVNNIVLIWLFRFYKHRLALKSSGATLKPAYRTENQLTIASAALMILVLIMLGFSAFMMSRPPEIPREFLAGNTGFAAMGASAVSVADSQSFSSDHGGFLPYSAPD